MNTGIVTFHCSYNYGSALQAYALQIAVEKLGHKATIIDYRSKNFDSYKLLRLRKPKNMVKMIHNYSRNKTRKDSFETFSARYFNLTSESYSYKKERRLFDLSNSFDCFICGSDQIWNLDCTNGVVAPFFLSFAGDKRRIAYAPSLAHTSFRSENFNKECVSDLLSHFDFLSVREEETVPLFQPLVDKPIDVVLDPTLLMNRGDYLEMTSDRVLESDYIFMYLLRDCPELIESTVAMATAEKLKVAYISEEDFDIPNSINLFGVGPEEFVSLIAHANLVLTNSFHATVFSVLFQKPFRVFATDKSGARMRDLLNNIGLSSRCVDAVCSSGIIDCDWNEVDRRLSSLREHSWAYLRRALS